MAVLFKTRSRKVLTSGNPSVGYGNYAVPGVLTNKHIKISINEYAMMLSMADAIDAAIQILRYDLQYSDDFFIDDIVDMLKKRDPLTGWSPID